MARPTMTYQVELPAGAKPTMVQTSLRLIASVDGATPGYSVNTAVMAISRPTIDRNGLVTMRNMRPNDVNGTAGDVIDAPAGTVYELGISWPGDGITVAFTVPDVAGTHPVAPDNLAIAPTDVVVIVAAENIIGLVEMVEAAADTKVSKAGDSMTGDLVLAPAADVAGLSGVHPLLDAAQTKVRQILATLSKRRVREETPYRRGLYRMADTLYGTGAAGIVVEIGDSHTVLGGLDGLNAEMYRLVNYIPDATTMLPLQSGFGGWDEVTGTVTEVTAGTATGYQCILQAGEHMLQNGLTCQRLWIAYWAVPSGGCTLNLGVVASGGDPLSGGAFDSWSTTDGALSAPELRIRSVGLLLYREWDIALYASGAGSVQVEPTHAFGQGQSNGVHVIRLAHSGYDSGPTEWGATEVDAYVAAVVDAADNAGAHVGAVMTLLGTNDYDAGDPDASNYQTNLEARFADLAVAAPLAAQVVVFPHRHSGATNWEANRAAAETVAQDIGATFVDVTDVIGDIGTPNAYGFGGDGVHLATAGNAALTMHLIECLLPGWRDPVAAVRVDGSRAVEETLRGEVRHRSLWRLYMDSFNLAKLILTDVDGDVLAQLSTQEGFGPALTLDGRSLVSIANQLYVTGPIDATTAGGTATADSHLIHRGYVHSYAQPLDSDLTAIAALTTTAFGRSVLGLADAAALRSLAAPVIDDDTGATIASSAAETSLLGSVLTIPAGMLKAGDVLQLEAFISHTSHAGGTTTARIRSKFGTTTHFDSGVTAALTASTTREHVLSIRYIVQSVGATGSIRCGGQLLGTGASVPAMVALASGVDVATATVDTTAAITINITGLLSVSDPACTLTLHAASLIHHRRQ